MKRHFFACAAMALAAWFHFSTAAFALPSEITKKIHELFWEKYPYGTDITLFDVSQFLRDQGLDPRVEIALLKVTKTKIPVAHENRFILTFSFLAFGVAPTKEDAGKTVNDIFASDIAHKLVQLIHFEGLNKLHGGLRGVSYEFINPKKGERSLWTIEEDLLIEPLTDEISTNSFGQDVRFNSHNWHKMQELDRWIRDMFAGVLIFRTIS